MRPDRTANSNILTYHKASQLYFEIATPQASPQPSPKSIIDIKWFQHLWDIFPWLSMEAENLREDRRLPHEFFIQLKPNAKPYISSTYQMDQKRTMELLNFMHKAISHGLIDAGPCTYISAAFMIPRSDPNKPCRVKKIKIF